MTLASRLSTAVSNFHLLFALQMCVVNISKGRQIFGTEIVYVYGLILCIQSHSTSCSVQHCKLVDSQPRPPVLLQKQTNTGKVCNSSSCQLEKQTNKKSTRKQTNKQTPKPKINKKTHPTKQQSQSKRLWKLVTCNYFQVKSLAQLQDMNLNSRTITLTATLPPGFKNKCCATLYHSLLESLIRKLTTRPAIYMPVSPLRPL